MTIGIFGGTFNPVHWGHVRTASEIKNALDLDKMLMVPCGLPPHREQPQVSAESRLDMLSLAIEEFPELVIDDRELKRHGPSYSVDTLASLHEDNPGQCYALCVGADAFLQLDSWHRWKQLFELAHLVVAHRPGWSLEDCRNQLSVELQKEMDKRLGKPGDIENHKAGMIVSLNVTEIDISSSDIRQRIANKESISGLVPVAVEAYIKKHGLYQV